MQADLGLIGTTIDAARGYLRTTSLFTSGFVTIGGPEECDSEPGLDGFSTACSRNLWSPRKVKSATDCPTGFTVQPYCWGWAYDQTGDFVGPLPVYDSSAIANTAFCRLGTENLPDGYTAEVNQFVMCKLLQRRGGQGLDADA